MYIDEKRKKKKNEKSLKASVSMKFGNFTGGKEASFISLSLFTIFFLMKFSLYNCLSHSGRYHLFAIPDRKVSLTGYMVLVDY
jgi:hypothetical protein